MRLFSAICLLLPAALPHARAETPVTGIQFEHLDWFLACDNSRTCRAAGYQPEDYDADASALPVSLLLTRRAGPGQPVRAELTLDPGEGRELPAVLSLQIDGKDLGAVEPDARTSTASLSGAQAAALLAALNRSTRIVAVGDDGRRWALSDKGAMAVLLKMDEFQGRLDTPGALVRKGKRSETEALPALPAPVVRIPALPDTRPEDAALASSPELRAALRALPLPEDESCDDLETDEDARLLEVARLSADKLLVSTRCRLAAYNVGVGYWIVDAKPPYRPRLVTTSGSDYDKGQIFASQKGRGLGDCWWTAQWSWDGAHFVQTREASSGLCRGFAGGAWQMPTLVSDVRR